MKSSHARDRHACRILAPDLQAAIQLFGFALTVASTAVQRVIRDIHTIIVAGYFIPARIATFAIDADLPLILTTFFPL